MNKINTFDEVQAKNRVQKLKSKLSKTKKEQEYSLCK